MPHDKTGAIIGTGVGALTGIIQARKQKDKSPKAFWNTVKKRSAVGAVSGAALGRAYQTHKTVKQHRRKQHASLQVDVANIVEQAKLRSLQLSSDLEMLSDWYVRLDGVNSSK